MPVERDTRFLNVDLVLVGGFDQEPILAALGKNVFALHEAAVFERDRSLVLELARPGLDVERTLARLVKWVERLPPPARRSWAAASRRVFDVGLQSGLKPHESHWAISQEQIAALARVGAEVVVTVYGAEWKTRRPAARSRSRAPRPARR